MTLRRGNLRTRGFRLLTLAALLGAVGCSTVEGYPVRWPWTKDSMLSEKYDLPPEEDSRYVNPPSYPKETMTPQLKVKDTKAALPRMGATGLGGGGPGGGPGGQ